MRRLIWVAALLALAGGSARAESKAEFEERLTREVTTILDKFLGVGMSQVVVLVDASPALMVPPMEPVGDKPKDKKDKKDGAQVLWSDYSNRTRRSLMPGFAARQQMVMREDDKPLKAKKEDKEQNPPPGLEPVIMWKIKRMIVTVTLDAGVNDAVSQEVGAMVMDMLGLDPKRGDKLNVYKLPFRSPWRLVFGAPSTWMGFLKWAAICLLVGGGAWLLYKWIPALIAFIRRRKIQVDVNKGEGEEGEPAEGEGEPAPEGEEPEKTGLLPGLVSALSLVGGKANGDHKGGEPKKEALSLFERVRAFQYVARKNAQLLGEVLSKDEDVQLAVVTSFLDPSLGGVVLKQLDPDKRKRVLEIMSKASHVMPDYLKKLEKEVELRLKHAIGGTELVADLVSQLDPQEQSEIVQSLWQKDQLLARKVYGMIFRFEDLFHLPERDLRILVEAVPVQDWVTAMQGMQAGFKQALGRVLPEERRRVFEQHLDMGAAGGKEGAESARWKILKTAKELHVQGRVSLQKPQNGGNGNGHHPANGAAPAVQAGQFYTANVGSGAAAGRR